MALLSSTRSESSPLFPFLNSEEQQTCKKAGDKKSLLRRCATVFFGAYTLRDTFGNPDICLRALRSESREAL